MALQPFQSQGPLGSAKTHTLPHHRAPSQLHHTSCCKSTVDLKGCNYLFTGIPFYGSLQPTLSALFLFILNYSYTLSECFLPNFQMAPALEKSEEPPSTVLFLAVGGRGAGWRGSPHSWLAFFFLLLLLHMIHPSSWGEGFLFPPPLGIVVYERKPLNDKPRLQVPCRGRRPAGTAASATTLHWHDRMKGCMSQSPARLPPPSCSTSPSFLFVVWIFLNH